MMSRKRNITVMVTAGEKNSLDRRILEEILVNEFLSKKSRYGGVK